MTERYDTVEGFEFLSESIEVLDTERNIPNAEPVPEGVSIERARARYFLESVYPYPKKLNLRTYYAELRRLQVELVKLQNWVKQNDERQIVVFEGRDAAGKGSTIKRFVEYLNPRGLRVVALDKPSDRERGQWYFQRYIAEFPTAGEIVLFDRSWYNRAGVEKVMGFCTEQEYEEFMKQAPQIERMIVRSGIRLIKQYFSVGPEEQARRFHERETNPLKQWKLSPIDIESQRRWDDYTDAKEATFRRTDSREAPWYLIKSDDMLRARLNSMRLVLGQTPYDGKDFDVVQQPDPLIVAKAAEVYGEPSDD